MFTTAVGHDKVVIKYSRYVYMGHIWVSPTAEVSEHTIA